MKRALLVGMAALTLGLVGCGELGERPDSPGDRQTANGNDGDRVRLPLEVLGPVGYRVDIEVEVDDAAGIDRLYIQGHRLGFRDSSTKKSRGPKGSVRVNGGPWIDLTDKKADLFEPEKSLGGIAGGYYTVRMTVPVSGLRNGINEIQFRLNETDGTSMGYRIIDVNLLRGGKAVLTPDQFVDDDPTKWEPPFDDPAEIAKGKNLWENAELTESPLSSRKLNATCADCHARDGRDLKYFNYSNWSIQARSEFHGLGPKQGQRIASYIRSLDMPAPIQARPWNPPYQPGPGLDSQPVQQWAAGAGIGWALDDDSEMLEFLFPDGTRKNKIAKVFDPQGQLNMRELPIALQLPDWNAWLPPVHGKDLWPGNTFTGGRANAAYEQSLRDLQVQGVAQLIASGDLGGVLRRIGGESREFIREGQTVGKGEAWRVLEGTIIDARNPRFSREITKEGLAKWSAVKQWELVQEFGIESTAPQVSGEEKRAWPGTGWATFPIAPHMLADDITAFDWQTKLVGKYESTAWYQLQLVLNAGQRQPSANMPVDWKYQFRHVTQFGTVSGVHHPLRLAASMVKGYQNMNNGEGPTKNGWKMQEVHPLWFYSETARDNTAVMDALAQYKSGLRGKVVGELIDAFVEVSDAIPEAQWERCAHGSGQDTAYCIEPATHTPSLPKKFFDVPEDFHADNFWRLLPLLKGKGVSLATRTDLADWCAKLWPKGNWHAQL